MYIKVTLSSLGSSGVTVGSPGSTYPNLTVGNTYTAYFLGSEWAVVDNAGGLTVPNGIQITIAPNAYWTLVSVTDIQAVQIYP